MAGSRDLQAPWRYRANLAAERGFRLLEVDASDDSRPILERLGFVPVTTTTPFIWSPGVRDFGRMGLELVNFDDPSETRSFEKGRFELYRVGPTTLGRATYEPGWRWSEHVGPTVGQRACPVEHVGLVLSGQAAVRMDDGTERVMKRRRLLLRPARATTAGWSATSRTSPCTSSGSEGYAT